MAVSKLMGHDAMNMTADMYYHYLEEEKAKAEEELFCLVGA
jgi:integrase